VADLTVAWQSSKDAVRALKVKVASAEGERDKAVSAMEEQLVVQRRELEEEFHGRLREARASSGLVGTSAVEVAVESAESMDKSAPPVTRKGRVLRPPARFRTEEESASPAVPVDDWAAELVDDPVSDVEEDPSEVAVERLDAAEPSVADSPPRRRVPRRGEFLEEASSSDEVPDTRVRDAMGDGGDSSSPDPDWSDASESDSCSSPNEEVRESACIDRQDGGEWVVSYESFV
jgi:hypothetical protein